MKLILEKNPGQLQLQQFAFSFSFRREYVCIYTITHLQTHNPYSTTDQPLFFWNLSFIFSNRLSF